MSKRLLSAAYDAGILHFDVAPMYGFGRSELLLREALGRRLDDVTITTKYGLDPPATSALAASAHRLARGVLSAFPMLKRRIRQAKINSAPSSMPPLTAVGAKASIDRSLTELGRSGIDLLLLHEASPERLQDDALLDLLREYRLSGKIGQFGVGSRRDRVLACIDQCTDFCSLIQFDWSAFSPVNAELEARPHIQHGSLGKTPPDFLPWLLADAKRTKQWNDELGLDLREPGVLSRLLFKASLIRNSKSIVLFSTRSIERIFENVRTAEDSNLQKPAKLLYELIQREYSNNGKIKEL